MVFAIFRIILGKNYTLHNFIFIRGLHTYMRDINFHNYTNKRLILVCHSSMRYILVTQKKAWNTHPCSKSTNEKTTKSLIDRMCSYDCPEPSYYFHVTAPADIVGFYPYSTLYLTISSNSLVSCHPNRFIL